MTTQRHEGRCTYDYNFIHKKVFNWFTDANGNATTPYSSYLLHICQTNGKGLRARPVVQTALTGHIFSCLTTILFENERSFFGTVRPVNPATDGSNGMNYIRTHKTLFSDNKIKESGHLPSYKNYGYTNLFYR